MKAGVPSPVGEEAVSPRRPEQCQSTTLDMPGQFQHGREDFVRSFPMVFVENLCRLCLHPSATQLRCKYHARSVQASGSVNLKLGLCTYAYSIVVMKRPLHDAILPGSAVGKQQNQLRACGLTNVCCGVSSCDRSASSPSESSRNPCNLVGDWWFLKCFVPRKRPGSNCETTPKHPKLRAAHGSFWLETCACGPLRKPAQLRPVAVLGGPPAAEHGAAKIWDRSECVTKSQSGLLKEWKKWGFHVHGASESEPNRRKLCLRQLQRTLES